MSLVLPSDAPGWKEGAAKLARWPVFSTTRNMKDGGVNDSLCIATSEETVHRRTIVFQLEQLIPGHFVNNKSFGFNSQRERCCGNRNVVVVTDYKNARQEFKKKVDIKRFLLKGFVVGNMSLPKLKHATKTVPTFR